ncbi:MAG: sel1 repeat family protein, partial [archaeon]|nr:sel1 repeat family protein [archaeon]
MLDQPSKSTHPDGETRFRYLTALELLRSDRTPDAVNILERNISDGCVESMVLLGTILADGDEEQRRRSIHLFKMATERGSDSGMRNLGYCYAIGLNVEKDKARGAQLYIESAKRGNARSACNIGVMYDYGNGVEQNREEAFRWYTLSAERGYSRGMTNLGEYYLWGRGTAKDVQSAIKWFKASDSPRANYRLYEIYTGEEGFQDSVFGRWHLERSADMGYSKAINAFAKVLDSE